MDYQFLSNSKVLLGIEFEKFVFNVLNYELDSLGKPSLLVESFESGKRNHGKNNDGSKFKFDFDALAILGIYSDDLTYIEVTNASYAVVCKKIQKTIEQINNHRFINYHGYDFKFIFITALPAEFAESFLCDDKRIEIWPIDRLLEIAKKYQIETSAFIDLLLSRTNKKDDLENISFFKKSIIDSKHIHTKDYLVKELKQKIKDIGISLVLGSGVSFPYNGLSWENLVNKLYDSLPHENKFEDTTEEAFKMIGGDATSKSEYARSILDAKFIRFLYKYLYPKRHYRFLSNESLFACAKLIQSQKKKVKKVITFNYDNYLEMMLDLSGFNYKTLFLPTDSLDSNFPIYHVHGFLPYDAKNIKKYSDTIILSEKDYFECYSDSANWQVCLQLETYKDDICLFVGNSITDFNEKRLISNTKIDYKYHYAIMYDKGLSQEDLSKIYSYFLYGLGIKIIWVKSIPEITNVIYSLINPAP